MRVDCSLHPRSARLPSRKTSRVGIGKMRSSERLDSRRSTGQRGERAAEKLLRRHGMEILERGFRFRGGEIDLIVGQVPEPASIAMLGGLGIGLLTRRRRRN